MQWAWENLVTWDLGNKKHRYNWDTHCHPYHRIGRWEHLQERPIFNGKTHGFL